MACRWEVIVNRHKIVSSARAIGFAAFSLGMAASASAPADEEQSPLVLKAQGNFYTAGTIELRSPNTTNAALPGDGTAPGHIAVNQMYVQFQIPQALKYKYSIVFMHGGGHTANIFLSTSDGRDGWFTSFTRRGFAVYAVDGANRGRGGWDPTARLQATVGLAPSSSMEGVNIYTEEAAWTAFRWGPTFGTFYSNTQFPKAYVEDYIKQIQPAYRNLPAPAEAQLQNAHIQAGLEALVDRIGPCILLGWSTGGGNVLAAATSSPARIANVKGLIGIEGFPGAVGNDGDPALVAKIPVLSVTGDNTSPAGAQAYVNSLVALGGDATEIFLPNIGIFGNGHTMAAELNNEQIADVLQNWINQHVKGARTDE